MTGPLATSQHPIYGDAVESLHRSGAHFVLCKADKKPLWKGWPERRPSPDVIVSYPGLIGIVPWSLRMAGVDVDAGDFQNITRLYPATQDYATRRGQHLYYGDVEPRGNRKFKAYSCSGDIRANSVTME